LVPTRPEFPWNLPTERGGSPSTDRFELKHSGPALGSSAGSTGALVGLRLAAPAGRPPLPVRSRRQLDRNI